MKPEHLLDAMEYISAEYIAEAKPHTEQHNESRVEQQAKSAAETVTLKQSQQKSQRSGKDITMSNRSFGQRILTGVIAAAACAVFVGGGIFIAMQAKQNRPETANSGNENSEIQEITDRNFLGGQGEIHIMQNMEIMYDDINYYFGCGHYAAPRSSESLTEMHEVGAEQSEFLTHVLTDGEQFFYRNNGSLYRMDDSGKREETPFFTISGYTDWTNVGIISIHKLSDDEYVIWASGDIGFRGCRFNAATKEADAMPDGAVPLGLYRESDDSILYCSGDYNEIFRYTFSTKESVPVTAGIRGRVNGEWIVRNNQLYLVSTSTENLDENGTYGKIDLATGVFSSIKYGFYSFVTDGDKIFGLVNDDRKLVCNDPEWTAPETLYDFSTAEIPERFRGEMQFKMPCCADENYIYLRVDANADLARELLFDRKTGKMLYFYLPMSDEEETAETDDTNIFGGTGAISPACMNSTGYSSFFFRDDTCYYGLSGAKWYRFALEGGSGEPLPDRINGAALPDLGFLTDGENVLTNDLVPVTGGEMYPSIEEIRSMLNPETHTASDYINPVSIYRVSDKYFMFLRTENQENFGTYKVFLWLDKDGNLLDISEEKDPIEEFGGCFTDVESEHVYYWCNGAGDVQHPGQSVTIRELPAPGKTADYQAPTDCAGFCCISGGKTLYLNANGALCGMEDGKQSILREGLGRIAGSIVLHDQVYYIEKAANYYDTSDSDRLMMLNLGTDSPTPVTIYESEQKNEAALLGWTGSGNRNEIVLMESGAHRILFIEPKSQTVTCELNIPTDETVSESYADLEMAAQDTTRAYIDYITNKNDAAAENLSGLDLYLSKDSSAYQKLHGMVSDVIWNTHYDSRADKELTVSNIQVKSNGTCTCDVHFDSVLSLTDGNSQAYSNDVCWAFVKEEGTWKAYDFSFIPSENQAASALNIEGLSDVSGSTFRGKLLKIKDPSRISLGISGQYGDAYEGRQVKDMAAEHGAFAAINAGTFMDLNGVGNGGTPFGIVIAQGKLLWGDMNDTYDIVGFDKDNRLRTGTMTGKQAVDLGLRDAVSSVPMIVDGKAVGREAASESGFDPRTAIGQTADGTVLMLVIEGRQADSLGATYEDVIDIMLQNGAVTAAHLGSGSQSHMICNNEMVTASSSLYGPRKLPNCWLVAPES